MIRHSLPYAVAGIIRNPNGEILLMRRKNTSHYEGFYGLPAGHGEKGENMYEALEREVKEETGLEVTTSHLIHVIHATGGNETDYLHLLFKTECLPGDPVIAEPDKCSDLLWTSPDSLPDNTVPYIRAALISIQKDETSSVFRT